MMVRIAALLVLVLIASGCTSSYVPGKPDESVRIKEVGSEDIGGKHNLTVVEMEVEIGDDSDTVKRILYEQDGETVDPKQALPDNMRPGLDWIKENAPEDAVVMSWWDYGNAIMTYTERDVVLRAPSREILTTTVSMYMGYEDDEIDCRACVSHDAIQDVAGMFLSEENTDAYEIMEKYGAGYLYVHADDSEKSVAFFIALDQEQGETSGTVLDAALNGELSGDFSLVYEDDVCRIYSFR